jgi:hypothetical protein
MTATATPTNKEADRRIRPGDGKKNPQPHIVRIVVVRRSKSQGASLDADRRQSDGRPALTLQEAEDILKSTDAPSSSAGTSLTQRSLGPASRQPKTMFEILKPTDIVVVGRKPASVRKTGQGLQLMGHDDHHTDTVLRVWTESDTIEYQCDEPFEIVGVKRAGWKIYDAPDNPFGFGKVKYIAQKRNGDTDEKPIWVWTSGLLPATANNQQYKMTFKIFDENGKNGELVDPDIVCGNPPPSP